MITLPLDRDHITRASAVMLPTYVVMNTVWGALFVLDPQGRLSRAPALSNARWMLPLWAWGAMWLALAALVVVAWVTSHRDRAVFALGVNGLAWFSWGLLVETSVGSQPLVSFLAGSQSVGWAIACAATIRSLRAREVTRG